MSKVKEDLSYYCLQFEAPCQVLITFLFFLLSPRLWSIQPFNCCNSSLRLLWVSPLEISHFKQVDLLLQGNKLISSLVVLHPCFSFAKGIIKHYKSRRCILLIYSSTQFEAIDGALFKVQISVSSGLKAN